MDILAKVSERSFTRDGQLAVGFLFCSVKNVGVRTVQVNGVDLAPGEAKSYPFVGKPYPGLTFKVNGSELRIMEIV